MGWDVRLLRQSGMKLMIFLFRFERTGTTVAFTFNAPTDIGSTSTGRFDCSLLLSFDATQSLGNGQECQVKLL